MSIIINMNCILIILGCCKRQPFLNNDENAPEDAAVDIVENPMFDPMMDMAEEPMQACQSGQ